MVPDDFEIVSHVFPRNSRLKINEVTAFIGFGFISKDIKKFMKSGNILLQQGLDRVKIQQRNPHNLPFRVAEGRFTRLEIWAAISGRTSIAIT